jgi:hypothetical protein
MSDMVLLSNEMRTRFASEELDERDFFHIEFNIEEGECAIYASAKSVSISTSAPERAVFIKLRVSGNKRAK